MKLPLTSRWPPVRLEVLKLTARGNRNGFVGTEIVGRVAFETGSVVDEAIGGELFLTQPIECIDTSGRY